MSELSILRIIEVTEDCENKDPVNIVYFITRKQCKPSAYTMNINIAHSLHISLYANLYHNLPITLFKVRRRAISFVQNVNLECPVCTMYMFTNIQIFVL